MIAPYIRVYSCNINQLEQCLSVNNNVILSYTAVSGEKTFCSVAPVNA